MVIISRSKSRSVSTVPLTRATVLPVGVIVVLLNIEVLAGEVVWAATVVAVLTARMKAIHVFRISVSITNKQEEGVSGGTPPVLPSQNVMLWIPYASFDRSAWQLRQNCDDELLAGLLESYQPFTNMRVG